VKNYNQKEETNIKKKTILEMVVIMPYTQASLILTSKDLPQNPVFTLLYKYYNNFYFDDQSIYRLV